MTVHQLQQRYAQQLIKQASSIQGEGEKTSFPDTLKGLVEQVSETHEASAEKVKGFIAGKDVQLHEVMAAGEEAHISFQFLLEVRNRILEAYQELSRTQV